MITTGSLIAGYRIEQLAGHGGMGVVYRATQLALGRPVALKLISPELADDERFRERFQRESRLAASIDHPNVIPVYEAGENNGSLFIAMRWVEGTDLHTMIRRGGGLEPERAAGIVAQVAAALDAAHERGLVHRDVKPANVLITAGRSEHVYLTDFGLVKRIAGSGELTRSGEFVGTIDYIAPEQIKGKGSDVCSDVYSLGCVLFHCLTGRVPFETDSDIAKIYAHLNELPPAPSELVPWLPAGLDEVVDRALAKDRAERYSSAGELARAAVEATVPPPPEAPTIAIAEPASRSAARRRAAILSGLAVLALAGGLALAGVFGGGDSGQAGGRSRAVPPDGSLLRARGRSTVYVEKAGARFAVPRAERSVFGYGRQKLESMSQAALRQLPKTPREGSLLKSYGSTLVWLVRGGRRRLSGAPAGADVAVIPSTGLAQIPLPPGGHSTSTTLAAPTSVEAGRGFFLSARVRSRGGVPKGACLFLRISLKGPKERANTPTVGGRCAARVAVTGLSGIRYSVRFVGDRGWRDSRAVSGPIEVQRR